MNWTVVIVWKLNPVSVSSKTWRQRFHLHSEGNLSKTTWEWVLAWTCESPSPKPHQEGKGAQQTEAGGVLADTLRLKGAPWWPARENCKEWSPVMGEGPPKNPQKQLGEKDHKCWRHSQGCQLHRPFVLFTLHPSTLRFWRNPNPRFLSWGKEATNTREQTREETHRTSLLTTMPCLEQAHTGEGRDLILNEFQSFDYCIWLDILINERMQFCD